MLSNVHHRRLTALCLALIATAAGTASAADVRAGREKAQQLCASCHGPTGAADNAMYPVIAGQHADYLLHSLRSYKSGARDNPVMAGIVAGLSEQDMRNLSAFFAAQEGLHDLSID